MQPLSQEPHAGHHPQPSSMCPWPERGMQVNVGSLAEAISAQRRTAGDAPAPTSPFPPGSGGTQGAPTPHAQPAAQTWSRREGTAGCSRASVRLQTVWPCL